MLISQNSIMYLITYYNLIILHYRLLFYTIHYLSLLLIYYNKITLTIIQITNIHIFSKIVECTNGIYNNFLKNKGFTGK